MRAFRREYPSSYASVPRARRDVASFARGCRLFGNDINDLTLAVGEACNNAAEHGHVAAGSFTLYCSYESGQMTIEVIDRGGGFDPEGKGQRCEPEHLGLRGLGIFIMRSLMDDISFTVKESGTSVRMVKYSLLESAKAAAGSIESDGPAQQWRGLGTVQDRLKSLLKFPRIQPGGRRQR